MRSSGARISLIFAFALFFASGCMPTIRSASVEVPRAATPVVIDEAVRKLEEQATRERIAQIMATPELQRTIRELAAAFVPGALDGLSTEESRDRIAAFTESLVETLVQTILVRLRPAVNDAIAEGLSRDAQRALDDMATTMASSAARGAIRAAAEDIPTTLSPAMREAFVTSLRSPELREASAQLSHDIAHGAILGSREAVAELQRNQTGVRPIERLENLVRRAGWVVGVLAVLFVALVAGGMLSLRSRAKHAEQASQESLRRVSMLVEALSASNPKAVGSDAARGPLQEDLEPEEPPRSPRPPRRRRPHV